VRKPCGLNAFLHPFLKRLICYNNPANCRLQFFTLLSQLVDA
jgi:hypothetical protein